MRLVPLTRMLSSPGITETKAQNHFPGPASWRPERRQLVRQKRGPIAQGNLGHIGPECDTASIYPGMGARHEMNFTRGLMGIRMIGAAEARRCCCAGAEAADRESHNDNSTRHPDGRIGWKCSR
jgi:hypothetical protein